MNIQVLDSATPAIKALPREITNNRSAMAAIGRRVAIELRGHFRRLDAKGNAKGWHRSHWWNREVAKATSLTSASPGEAVVTIASKQFLHKLLGGTVKADSGKKLAIPLRSAAKAAGSPGEWSNPGDGQLVGFQTRKGYFLFRNLGSNGSGAKGQRLQAWYKLVSSVRHLADPEALPPRQNLEAAIEDQGRREMAALIRRKGGQS